MTTGSEYRPRLLNAAPEGSRFVSGRKHDGLNITGEKPASLVIPSTPSDSRHGAKNALANLRRMLGGGK